ncbi:MAG: tetratricopeptide repeat protein [Leptolyngbyaceae bacterium]|nr:tetratricopeptide repeat protein [Leptolyngbyaceae bacterium]
MAKKKTARSLMQKGFGKIRLLPELQKAEALMAREKWAEARQVLENLNQNYPGNPDVLTDLVNVCVELHDIPSYTRACEQLVQAAPNDSDAAYGLAGGYLTCLHPLLALQAFHHALDRFPNHEKAQGARKLVVDLEGQMAETLEEMGLTGEEGRRIALLHEQGQAYLERGDYAQARQAEEAVLRIKPDFWSAHNNLCLICYSEGDMEGAIALAQNTLEQQPDNIHALSNLTRFYSVQGKWEQAQVFGERLKASQAKAWDLWTKKVEALSYLGDDAGILEVFEQAKAADDLKTTGGLFHHWVAVAMARSGQSQQAEQQWKEALKKSPGLTLAQANLNDLRKMVGQRHGAWAFDLNYWLNRSDVEDLTVILKSVFQSKDEAGMTKAIQRYLQEHPHIIQLIPVLLDRGDPAGREFALRCAETAEKPEMLEALRIFALSQSGTDELRNKAAVKVSEAGLLPPGPVRLWIKGEWRDILLIAYQFHHDPPTRHPRQIEDWLREALSLLKQQNAEAAKEAEQLLQQALAVKPDAPDLLNNLALAYGLQDREEDAMRLIQQLVEQHPEYVCGRAAMAKWQIRQGDLEAAEAILKPMISYKRFHVDDFAVFSSAYLELLMAQKRPEAAEGWLNLWKTVDPEHPELKAWQQRLAAPSLLQKFSKFFK